MNIFKYLVLSILAISSLSSYAQCGTDERAQMSLNDFLNEGETFADFIDSQVDFEFQESYDYKNKKAIRTIPVVFHVIHQYGEENITKEQIEDQIRVLNEDFQRLNADTVNTPAVFKDRAANFELEFKLARVAPDGSCTEGITRHYSHLTDEPDGYDWCKSVVMWDYRKYLNIWVVNTIDDGDLNTGTRILGYAVFPGDNNASSRDGIVIRSDEVGTIGTSNQTGRTLTHEIGHWLGLYHTFQGGCTTVKNWTDRVDDTPPVAEASRGCTKGANTCGNDSPNEIDNIENYMDYSDDACMNMFTKGQKARVDAFLANSNLRGRNIEPNNIVATGVNTSPNCGPQADFWTESGRITICAGEALKFIDYTYNGEVDDRTWKFQGGSPLESTYENPTVVYNTPGTYEVELEVSNALGTTSLKRTAMITVLPEAAELDAPYGTDFADLEDIQDWTMEKHIDWGWRRTTAVGYSGNECLEAKVNQFGIFMARYDLILPPVDLTNHEGPLKLSFKAAYSPRYEDFTETLLAYVSEDCGESWRIVNGFHANNGLGDGEIRPGWIPTSQSDWVYKEIDLSRFDDNDNLIVKFTAVSQSGNSIFLDDINIGSYGLSVPSYEGDLDLNLVPNPAQDQVTINLSENHSSFKVSIVDITGRLLLQQNLNQNQRNINTSSLPNGMYTVRIETEGERWTKKLVINR